MCFIDDIFSAYFQGTVGGFTSNSEISPKMLQTVKNAVRPVNFRHFPIHSSKEKVCIRK